MDPLSPDTPPLHQQAQPLNINEVDAEDNVSTFIAEDPSLRIKSKRITTIYSEKDHLSTNAKEDCGGKSEVVSYQTDDHGEEDAGDECKIEQPKLERNDECLEEDPLSTKIEDIKEECCDEESEKVTDGAIVYSKLNGADECKIELPKTEDNGEFSEINLVSSGAFDVKVDCDEKPEVITDETHVLSNEYVKDECKSEEHDIEIPDVADSEEPRNKRYNLRQNRKQIKYLEREEFVSVWSDDSDVDPDFAPVPEGEEDEKELKPIPEITEKRSKRIKSKTKRRKKKTFPRRWRAKLSVCLYCQKECRTVSRHLKLVHGNEREVAQAMNLKKGSRERKAALTLLCNKGALIHNTNVITQNKGTLIFCRQSKFNNDYKSILICDHCFGFYPGKHSLSVHMKHCIILNLTKSLTNEDNIKNTSKQSKKKFDNFTDVSKQKKVCYYCNKLVSKLVNHLIQDHKEENEVVRLMNLKLKSKERFQAIQTLKRKGNFVFIKSLLENYSNVKCKSLPCEYCLGFYSPTNLFQHTQKCYLSTVPLGNKEKEGNNTILDQVKQTVVDSSLLLSSSIDEDKSNMSSLAKEGNEVIETIINDQLIWRYGVKIADLDEEVVGDARYFRLSTLARIVIRLRTENLSLQTLNDCLKTKYLNQILKITARICSLHKEPGKQESIIRTSIRHCCMIVKSDSVEKESTKLEEIEEFLRALKLVNSKENQVSSLSTEKQVAEEVNYELPCDEKELRETLNEETTTGFPITPTRSEVLTTFQQSNVSKLEDFESDELEDKSEQVQDLPEHLGTDSRIDEATPLIEESYEDQLFQKHRGKKKNICLFCNKRYKGLSHHWKHNHANEPEIKHLKLLQEGSTERILLLRELTNKGNFFHNLNAMKLNKGLVIPVRLNSKDDKVPCEFCLGFFVKESVSNHVNRCPFNVFERVREGIIKGPVFTSPHILKAQSTLVEDLKEVLSSISDESIKEIVNNDCLIMTFGLIYKDQEDSSDCGTDKTLLRINELARLVKEVKVLVDDVSLLKDCLQTKHFPTILKSAKKLIEQECEEDIKVRFERLRKILITCCSIVRAECVIQKLKVGFVENDFLKMVFEDWILSPEEKEDLVLKRHIMLKKLLVNLNEAESFTVDSEREVNPNDKRLVCVKLPWTENEIDTVSDYFANHIKEKKIPGRCEVQRCIDENECLTRRHWVSVKSKVHHLMKHRRKEAPTNSVQANKITFNKKLISKNRFGQQGQTLLQSSKTLPSRNLRAKYPKIEESFLPNESIPSSSSLETVQEAASMIESYEQVINTLTNKKPKESRNLKLKTEGDKTYLLLDSFCATEIESIPSFTIEPQKGKSCSKREWSQCETETVKNYFERHIKKRKVPNKYECEDCIEDNEVLSSRDWVSVKSKVNNIIQNKSTSKQGRHISKDVNLESSSIQDILQEKDKSNKDLEDKNQNEDITDAKFEARKTTKKSNNENKQNIQDNTSSKNILAPKNKPKTSWTDAENAAIYKFFSLNIEELKVPGKRECEKCIKKNPSLSGRSWVVVKSKVHNIITRIKRQAL